MASYNLICEDRTLVKTNDDALFSGAQDVDSITVTFGATWNNYTNKTGVFYVNHDHVYVVPFSGNTVNIPAEVLVNRGVFTFGVYATNGTKRLTTSALKFTVSEGVIISGVSPGGPTLDIYSSLKNLDQRVMALETGGGGSGGGSSDGFELVVDNTLTSRTTEINFGNFDNGDWKEIFILINAVAIDTTTSTVALYPCSNSFYDFYPGTGKSAEIYTHLKKIDDNYLFYELAYNTSAEGKRGDLQGSLLRIGRNANNVTLDLRIRRDYFEPNTTVKCWVRK